MAKYTRNKIVAELKAVKSLSGAKLCNIDLSELDLNNVDFSRADLSGANFSGTNLQGANLRATNLSNANLSNANLSGADLSEIGRIRIDERGNTRTYRYLGTNLSGADLSNTNLCKANLCKANLSEANLSEAKLIDSKLEDVDLSTAIISNTTFSIKSLFGVVYKPEQLFGMILLGIEEYKSELLFEKNHLKIALSKETPSTLNLISLLIYFEHQYDILYLFLYGEYQNIDDFQRLIKGSPYHWMMNNKNALTISSVVINSPGDLAFLGLSPINKIIVSFALAFTIGASPNIYSDLQARFAKTEKQELELKKLRLECEKLELDINNKKEAIPDHQTTYLQTYELNDSNHLIEEIEKQRNVISSQHPDPHCLFIVKCVRQNGLLKNKLSDIEAANMLKLIQDKEKTKFLALSKELGDLKITETDLNQE